MGLRLAAGALKLAYGQETLQASGPILSSVEATQRKDGQLQMKVKEGGLEWKPRRPRASLPLSTSCRA